VGTVEDMDPLQFAWGVALVATLWALIQGLIRAYVYRSGEIDHTRTMRISATFALTVGIIGLACLVTLTLVILVG
jgi:hypothetical protein